ncbi:MAG: hypothetical protein JWN72_2538, partial [Thermoleophilia bacterium]|nr:hypothetical protein [Thermoleophilia bacterium]
RVTGPGAGTTSGVTIWIRAWQGASDGRTSSGVSTSRVNFTPGGFQQFQLLTDGPIAFDDGARITGPVHSNGIGATSGIAVGLVPGARIDCAGEFARISVSSGIVADSLPSACRRIANGTRWNLGVVKTTFEGIRTATAAGGHGVMVVNAIGGGDVRVRLAGDTIVVGGVTKSIGEGIAVLVDGNVVVSGHTTGRVTIASDPLSADRGQIRVDGDLVGTGSRASIGLYTEGDVVVSTRPCVARIDAAIIAARGAMTIDRGLRTEVAQLDSVGCGKVEMFGSIASAESPVLRWSWPGGGSTGYDERSYAWNPRLVRNPPPWTPVIEGWQANDLQEAGQECGSGGTWEVACG